MTPNLENQLSKIMWKAFLTDGDYVEEIVNES